LGLYQLVEECLEVIVGSYVVAELTAFGGGEKDKQVVNISGKRIY
jgi:hypothetical protein